MLPLRCSLLLLASSSIAVAGACPNDQILEYLPTAEAPIGTLNSSGRLNPTADFNGDSIPDRYRLGHSNDSLSIYYGDTKDPVDLTQFDFGFDVGSAHAVGDVNGDGTDDIVILERDPVNVNDALRTHVYLGSTTGLVDTAFEGDVRAGIMNDLELVDINSDGVLDLLSTISDQPAAGVAFNNFDYQLGNGDGTFGPLQEMFPGDNTYRSLMQLIGDIDNNGTQELIVRTSGQPGESIYSIEGDATLEFLSSVSLGSNTSRLTFKDLNGDGLADVYATRNVNTGDDLIGQFSYRLQTPSGQFVWQDSVQLTGRRHGPDPAAVIDVNLDGILDIVAVASRHMNSDNPGSLNLLLGNPAGGFEAPIEYYSEVRPDTSFGAESFAPIQSVYLSDVDYDGNPDLLINREIDDHPDDQVFILNVGCLGNPCNADLSGDAQVDSADLAELLAGWGATGPADLDGSGAIDAGDLAILLAAWGPC